MILPSDAEFHTPPSDDFRYFLGRAKGNAVQRSKPRLTMQTTNLNAPLTETNTCPLCGALPMMAQARGGGGGCQEAGAGVTVVVHVNSSDRDCLLWAGYLEISRVASSW
mgnify:CR=1 FL=1